MSLIETANLLVAAKPDLSTLLADLKGDAYSQEDRWAAFTILVKHNVFVNEQGYGNGLIDGLESVSGSEYTLYDDFGCDRHVSMTYVEMYENLLDKIKWKEDMAPTEQSLRDWKERVLQSGYSGFCHDW